MAKNSFFTKVKKNIHPKQPLGEAAILGAIGGAVFYLSIGIFFSPMTIHLDLLLLCILLGLLGGALPELIFLAAGDSILIVRSWTMVAILLFLLPAFIMSTGYTFSFAYGYLVYLLNTARVKGLPNT